jgi:hypothetical protein
VGIGSGVSAGLVSADRWRVGLVRRAAQERKRERKQFGARQGAGLEL